MSSMLSVGLLVSALAHAQSAPPVPALVNRGSITAVVPVDMGGQYRGGAILTEGDGYPDLLVQTNAGRVGLALSRGPGSLADLGLYDLLPSGFDVVSAWHVVGVGDFNGDGHADLLWQGPTGSVVVWFNNGSTPATGRYVYSGASAWRIVAVADMNGDSKPDIIWQSPTGQVVVWLMQGSTLRSAQYLSLVSSVWTVVGAADFDGDGAADLLWQSPTGTLVTWTMHGTSMASAHVYFAGPTNWRVISVGDLLPQPHGFHPPDLVWQGPKDDIVVWFLGDNPTIVRYVKATTSGWQFSATP